MATTLTKTFSKRSGGSHSCVGAKRPAKDIMIDYLYETFEEDGSKTIHMPTD